VYSAHPQASGHFLVVLGGSGASGGESSGHSWSAALTGDCTSDALRCVGSFCPLAACCMSSTTVLSCMQQEVGRPEALLIAA
jgi:hypothetical protein